MPTLRRPSSPLLAVLAGAALLALALALGTALQISALASLDEAVYKLSAVRYADGGLGAVLADDIARGPARLYSVVLAPLFAVLPGDAGVRAGRALTTVLWCASAVPVFLLARRVVASPGLAVAAALLAVAVPWATVSTVLFSEALALLLFAWAVVAMAAALRAPSPGRDLLVVALLAALVGTRAQFAVLPAAWVAAVLLLGLAPARRRAGTWRAAAADLWRRHPVTLALAALAVVAGLGLLVAGAAGVQARRFAGPYGDVLDRGSLPTGLPTAAVFVAATLALGTGVVPAILAAAWWRDAVRGDAGGEAFRLAVLATVLLVALWALTTFAQGGWQGRDIAEERYHVYWVPLLMIGAVAALERARLGTRTLALGGAAVALLLALAPATAGLSGERAFQVPVAATVTNVVDRLGLGSQRLPLALLALAITGLAVLGWRRARWLALAPALVVQLAFGGYAIATMHGAVPGVAGVTPPVAFADRAWVDRATDGDPAVALVADRPTAAAGQELELAFWNDELGRTLRFPATGRAAPPFPVDALPRTGAAAGADLVVRPEPPARRVLADVDAPLVQLEGRALRAEGGAVLVEPARPARVRWLAEGLGPEAGFPGPVAVTAAPARVTLRLVSPAGTAGGTVRVALDEVDREVAVAAGGAAEVRVEACDGARGTLTPVGPVGGAVRLDAVRLDRC